MHSVLRSVLPFVIAGAVIGCSGNDDECGVSDTSKVLSVKKKGAEPLCPDLTPADLNEPGTPEEGCAGVSDSAACSVRFDCTTTDPDGFVTRTEGLLEKDGSNASGDVTVTLTEPGGTPVTCVYTIVVG